MTDMENKFRKLEDLPKAITLLINKVKSLAEKVNEMSRITDVPNEQTEWLVKREAEASCVKKKGSKK